MLNFLLSGIALLSYAGLKFWRTKIFYPSIVFSTMWGLACVVTGLILGGAFGELFLDDYYKFSYLDTYIPWFAFISISAFSLAHKLFPGKQVNLCFSLAFLTRIVKRYHWIMWVNFFGGILRIILMVSLVGIDSVMDYRLAANEMMNTGLGTVGLVFRITSYVQMLANFYVALAGCKAGMQTLKFKEVVFLFILYSPTQLATGGRLFILYFVLFYFGSFLLGRGISLNKHRSFLERHEKKTILLAFVGMLSLVSLIALSRQSETKYANESAIAKFTYIYEGMLESEHYMKFYPPEEISPDYGEFLLTGRSEMYLQYRKYLLMTKMSSIVISAITSLYTGFGYVGSLVVWGILAFILEAISIKCLRRLTIIRFFVLLTILKIMYESIISNPIQGNYAVYELLILLALFYKPIFNDTKT